MAAYSDLVAKMAHYNHLVCAPPVPARGHPACRVALRLVHPQLSRREDLLAERGPEVSSRMTTVTVWSTLPAIALVALQLSAQRSNRSHAQADRIGGIGQLGRSRIDRRGAAHAQNIFQRPGAGKQLCLAAGRRHHLKSDRKP